MNASVFRDFWARVMLESSQNCTSHIRVQFENFQSNTSDDLSHEMHEQISYEFNLLYTQQNYSIVVFP